MIRTLRRWLVSPLGALGSPLRVALALSWLGALAPAQTACLNTETVCEGGPDHCNCPAYVAAVPGVVSEIGSWLGPWDWTQFMPPPPMGNENPEFSHAALIPVGPYQGMVLLWRNAEDGANPTAPPTETWIFDPGQPQVLYKLRSTPVEPDGTGGFRAVNSFCAGQSWQDGYLVVAGGASPVTPPDSIHRFAPQNLVYPPAGLAGPGSPPLISGQPWIYVAHMSLGRFYPTCIPLLWATIHAGPANPDIPGGSTLVLGGDPENVIVPDLGNDWLQAVLPLSAGNPVSQTLVADGNGIAATPSEFGTLTPETYVRMPVATPPQPTLDYYPRSFALASTDSFPANKRNIFVAFDVIPAAFQGGHANPPTNEAGRSWIFKPRVDPSQLEWELWYGPRGTSSTTTYNERNYAGAVLFHHKQPTDYFNRVLMFGGRDKEPNLLWRRVEDDATPTGAPETGTWITKTHCLRTGRSEHNTVVLPTGRVLLIGGMYGFTSNGRLMPAYCPELYDPGTRGFATGATSWRMARRPSVVGDMPFPRLYHNVAVLLLNGTVFNAGGIDYSSEGFPDGSYSGEVFAPPYTEHPDRPTLQSVTNIEPQFGSAFDVTVLHDGGQNANKPILGFVLLRPAAVTHHFDNDQRLIELQHFLLEDPPNDTQVFRVFAPSDELAPPGYYTLWAIRGTQDAAPIDRVPSQMGVLLRVKP